MNQDYRFVGLLKKVIEREYNGNSYRTAWIESPQTTDTYFHPNSLIHKHQAELIKENRLILFETRINRTDIGERQDAFNADLDCENYIIEHLEYYDEPTLQFVVDNAIEDLRDQILYRIKALDQVAVGSPVTSLLSNSKCNIPELSEAAVKTVAVSNANLSSSSSNSFLESIFQANTTEYNQSLFKILVEGIKVIGTDEVYEQAKFLILFNSHSPVEGYSHLTSSFYQKATEDFKFRLWLEGLIEYCDTCILKAKFEEANKAQKESILARCNGNSAGFLVMDSAISKASAETVAYFSGIRNKLVKELSSARRSIQVAVAWFTNAELFGVLCSKLTEGIKVELIIINDYINNWEYGLPWGKFIEAGGKLYFSEYPDIMHHKFCIIDGKTLFNGSYNWTYYAEESNDENIILFKGDRRFVKKFQEEFSRLQEKLRKVEIPVVPLDASQIKRFERLAFRSYLSKDLALKAKAVKESNVVYSSDLVNAAVVLDPGNDEAEQFKNSIALEASLEKAIQETIDIATEVAQSNISEKLDKEIKLEPELKNNTKEQRHDTDDNSTTTKAPVLKPELDSTHKSIQPNFSTYATRDTSRSKVNSPVVNYPSIKKLTKPSPASATSTPVKSSHTYTTYSVPAPRSQKFLYDNLQLVFALDFSGSMDQEGRELYSSGKIQKVINMIFAISKGLSSEQNVDLFLFHTNSIQVPAAITDSNYSNFVKSEILPNYKMGGTDIYAPIKDIHNKYSKLANPKTVFAIVITDGRNSKKETDLKIKKHLEEHQGVPIFWQFVGLGSNFAFLKSLEDGCNNVSFFSLDDVQDVSNDELKKRLLQKFPKWMAAVEDKA